MGKAFGRVEHQGRRFPLLLLLLCTACVGNGASRSGAGGDAALGPFEPDAPRTYVAKVKTLLTGGAPAADELAQIERDPAALASLVRGWLASPPSRQIMLDFFADAFQQSQASADGLRDLYDQQNTPDPNLVLNLRESFARTAQAMADRKEPFTAVATTQRFMMTTAMMAYYAYTDTSGRDDAYKMSNRWFAANANLTVTLVEKRGPVDLTAAANPQGPDYLTFYVPNLHTLFTANNNATLEADELAACAAIDPLRFDRSTVDGGGAMLVANLYGFLRGGGMSTRKPSVRDANQTYRCNVQGSPIPFLTPADYNDWREVTVRAPAGAEVPSTFFDLPTLRASATLLMDSVRVGYFTTPAFLAQYPSNVSNSSRATTNQALIVGLGGQVDGSAQLPVTFPTAIDPEHAANPACFACHQSLDPMRQYFRQSYSVTYSKQTDKKVFLYPAGFSFGGTTGAGEGVGDFARHIAEHPGFAAAWVVKLCSWATSTHCLPTDPEVLRLAADFQANNFDFYRMAEQLFSSPLVTYAEPTVSARTNGKQASIARRHQLCAILNARLGLTDVCERSRQRDDGGNNVPSRTASMAGDLYVRGSSAPLYLTTPDPFYANNLENVCALLASTLIDVKDSPWATSDALDAALQRIASDLLGLRAQEALAVVALLQAHYDASLAASKSATRALRSTFVAACRSPFVAGVGAL